MNACVVGWAAFGLEPEPCPGLPAIVTVSQACACGHVVTSDACWSCLAAIAALGELDDWGCDPCMQADDRYCVAPLRIEQIRAGCAEDRRGSDPRAAAERHRAAQAGGCQEGDHDWCLAALDVAGRRIAELEAVLSDAGVPK